MPMVLEKRGTNSFAIGSFQAKTYFAELLRSVEDGNSVIITRNGHDVAVLEGKKRQADDKAMNAVQRLRTLSQNIADKNQNETASRVTVDEIMAMRDEGRR